MKSLKKIKITMHEKERTAEEQILKLHQEISLQQKRFRQFQAQTQELLQALIDRENQISRDKLKLNSQKAVSQSNQFPPFVNQLNTNSSAGKELLELIQIGQTKEEKSDFNIPIVAPWIGQKKALIITAKNSEQSCYFLNALILQIILQMPRVIRFTLLDPHTQGLAFPIQNHITPWLSTQESDLTQILNQIKNDISHTISARLDKDIRSYEQLPKSFHTSDPFEIIVLANYPKDFRKEDFEQLQKIAQNGPVAGKYLIIHQIQDLEQDKSPLPPERCHLIDLDNLPEAPRGFRNTFTAYPQEFSKILTHFTAIAPKNEPIPYTSSIGLSDEQLWQKRAAYNVKSPIGSAGHDTHLELTFGDGPNGFLSAHAVWAGTTGAGKSSGYHTLICGLAQRYSPHELNFYLVDGKNGVEFQPYQNLPHARTVILHSQPELSRSVLKELILEMEHRNEIFAKSKVTNLRDYHLAGQPLGRLPRLLLIADEYQEFFDRDKNDEASQSILKLSQQGRSAGIHMLLGSQRFTGTGLHGHSSVMGNFHTRIAMRMVGDEINSLSEFGPNGRELIKKCNKSGKSVINAHSGDDTKNQYGTIAYITKEEISKIVEDLTQRSNSLLGLNSTTVIDGMDQPSLGQSPTLKYLIKQSSPPKPIHWRTLASKPTKEGGLEIEDWKEEQRILLLGEPFTIYGQVHARIKRANLENILMIGDNHPIIYSLLASMLTSLSLHPNNRNTQIIIFHPEREKRHEHLHQIAQILALLGICILWVGDQTDLNQCLERLTQKLNPTQKTTTSGSIFLWLTECETNQSLLKGTDKFGIPEPSPSGKLLEQLIHQGPSAGIHVLMHFSLPTPMYQILDKKILHQFRHKILHQMGEEDSFNILIDGQASKLQSHGPKPVAALYVDTITSKQIRFKPYAPKSDKDFHALTQKLKTTINQWRCP